MSDSFQGNKSIGGIIRQRVSVGEVAENMEEKQAQIEAGLINILPEKGAGKGGKVRASSFEPQGKSGGVKASSGAAGADEVDESDTIDAPDMPGDELDMVPPSSGASGGASAGEAVRALESMGIGNMGNVYEAMFALIQQAFGTKKDSYQRIRVSANQAFQHKMQAIAAQRTEIAEKVEEARDNFWASVALSIGKCVATLASALAPVAGLAAPWLNTAVGVGGAVIAAGLEIGGQYMIMQNTTEGAGHRADMAGVNSLAQNALKETEEADKAKEEQLLENNKEYINRLMEMLKEMERLWSQSVDHTLQMGK